MKVTKVTREYWVLDGEKVYFNEPLDHDLTVEAMQKLWDDAQAHIRLAGSLGERPAMPLVVTAEIEGVGPARLAFAWIKNPNAPLILGQTNFFMEFDVCFFRCNCSALLRGMNIPRLGHEVG